MITMTTGRVHCLKCWPVPFDAMVAGAKPYEIRKDDRDYRVGDILIPRLWNPTSQTYDGRHIARLVTYKTSGGEWGLPPDLCVLGLVPCDPPLHPSYFVEDTIDDVMAHVIKMRQERPTVIVVSR